MKSSSADTEKESIASVGAAAAPALQQQPPAAPQPSSAAAAIFKRAQDIRATFYPESSESSESDWEA